MSTISVKAGSDLRRTGSVSFDVTIDARDARKIKTPPAVQILAYQSGAVVWATAGYADRTFALGGQSGSSGDGTPFGWLTGGAHCHVDLYGFAQNGSQVILSGVDFDATDA